MLSTTSNSESQLIRELRRDSEKTVVMLAVLARASVHHWHASMWECIPVMPVIHECWVINVQLSDPSLHSHWHTSVKVPESLSSLHCNYSSTLTWGNLFGPSGSDSGNFGQTTQQVTEMAALQPIASFFSTFHTSSHLLVLGHPC